MKAIGQAMLKATGAVDGRWTLFIDGFMRDHAVTDLVLFGDCRPLHMAAHRMAQLRKIKRSRLRGRLYPA